MVVRPDSFFFSYHSVTGQVLRSGTNTPDPRIGADIPSWTRISESNERLMVHVTHAWDR